MNDGFSVTLLDGVTGSGKTEVYFEAIAATLAKGKQALVLMPEIALTSHFIARCQERFGAKPAEWHSGLSAPLRGRVWRAVAENQAKLVVGARSALFLPFPDLGLIVVDEEHDAGYKQEERVAYQARDMAVLRGSLGEFPVVLSSATPSIESLVNAAQGRYRRTSSSSSATRPRAFPTSRRSTCARARPSAANGFRRFWSRRSPRLWRAASRRFSFSIAAAMRRSPSAGIAASNSNAPTARRGWSSTASAAASNATIAAPSCRSPRPVPNCGAEHSLVPCGPGIERIDEEVAALFPDARRVLLSSDLTPGVSDLRETLREIEDREVDIVIGTQLVAKGHHFPGLALVGVVDADLGLSHADPRAAERTFQLLNQVTGRAGREVIPGRGLIQTYMPEHPVIQALASGDRDAFLAREIEARKAATMPPFGRLASLLVSAGSRDAAESYARSLARAAPPAHKIEVLGPAEAPLAVIRGRFRFRLLVKAAREADLQAYLRLWLSQAPKPKGDVRLNVDVDPYSFL